MPGFLVDLLVKLAVNFGIPFAVTWLTDRLPFLKAWAPALIKILEDLVKEIQGGTPKPVAKKVAKSRIKRECFGVGCPVDTK